MHNMVKKVILRDGVIWFMISINDHLYIFFNIAKKNHWKIMVTWLGFVQTMFSYIQRTYIFCQEHLCSTMVLHYCVTYFYFYVMIAATYNFDIAFIHTMIIVPDYFAINCVALTDTVDTCTPVHNDHLNYYMLLHCHLSDYMLSLWPFCFIMYLLWSFQ